MDLCVLALQGRELVALYSYNGAEDFKFKIGDQMEILEEHQASFSKRASLILYFGEN